MEAHTVYGPPGCGKTTEMLKRVEEAKSRYKASEICFLSFTKAGAAEALKRLGLSRSDKICTIHSLMFRLNNISGASVVDSKKLRVFSSKTGFRFKGQANDTGEQMELGDQYLAILSKQVNRGTDLREEYYDSDRPGDWSGFEFFCRSYLSWKSSNGFVDFNDMLAMYVANPVDHGAAVVFIDEAQDLSNLQWAVVDKMASFKRVKEIHIAGDDDQAIYEWSGASPHGMAEFQDRYNSSGLILSQSWRVPVSVHGVAMGIAATIKSRVDKKYSPRPAQGLVRRMSSFNPQSISAGEDVLILCRSYVTRKEVEDELILSRIPYKNEGGLPGLFSSRIADAIRIFRKLERGESISSSEVEKLALVANTHTKEEIQSKNFLPMLRRGFLRSLVVPPQLVDFYRDADLDSEPSVRLSTIHTAKGREAERVILHTGLTSRTLTDMDKNGDAEARVWYVGATRAKDTLDILEGENPYPV